MPTIAPFAFVVLLIQRVVTEKLYIWDLYFHQQINSKHLSKKKY